MQPLPRTVADKITAAEQLKQEGNEHFKSKEFKKAIGCYQRVEAIRHTFPVSSTDTPAVVGRLVHHWAAFQRQRWGRYGRSLLWVRIGREAHCRAGGAGGRLDEDDEPQLSGLLHQRGEMGKGEHAGDESELVASFTSW
eukprot:COSAG01_NODE_875_length_12972_cov_61.925503_6_plen_139_part_00